MAWCLVKHGDDFTFYVCFYMLIELELEQCKKPEIRHRRVPEPGRTHIVP